MQEDVRLLCLGHVFTNTHILAATTFPYTHPYPHILEMLGIKVQLQYITN